MSSQPSNNNPPPLHTTTGSYYPAQDLFAMASPSTMESGEPWSGELARARTKAQFDGTSSSLQPRRLSMAATATATASTDESNPKYPPISSIPLMSPERLARASPDNPENDKQDTVLYLAYGSNLCAETFLGRRAIRPLSQINVSAPAFDLAFDLPGAPYWEPCFANLTPRKLPVPPKFPPNNNNNNTNNTNDDDENNLKESKESKGWTKGLYGVVYEVTQSDYRTIVATEGGGSSYKDVYTPCFALPPTSTTTTNNKPFLAHTLYAPRIPLPPPDKQPSRCWWWRRWSRMFQPVVRPDPDHAQPSLRYLNLIRDGAREHAMPDDYRSYLDDTLRPYTKTTTRQVIGGWLLGLVVLPSFMLVMGLSRVVADKETGKVPGWMAAMMAFVMNVAWVCHDGFFKKVFGDGERTIEEEDREEEDRGTKEKGMGWGGEDVDAEVMDEKMGLLDDY